MANHLGHSDTTRPRLYIVLSENSREQASETESSVVPGLNGLWRQRPSAHTEATLVASGYHVCSLQDLPFRLGPVIYEVECRGKGADTREVISARHLAHWTRRTAWSFACDSVEHILPLFEWGYPCEDRPRQALAMARAHLAGHATADELHDAREAAHHAIEEIRGDVPWDAGFLAGCAADNAAAGDYQSAIWMATRAAAREPRWTNLWAAAWTARRSDLGAALADAWGAATGEERAWQVQRLKAYLSGATPQDRVVHTALGSRTS